MNKQYKIGDEVLVRGIINSEVRNGGIHVLHEGVDAFYMLDQIHEPQKVVVPKFIADLIEKLKIDEYTIGEIGAYVYDDEEQKWIDDNEELFYRAFLDGYEIGQEKLYTVEIPNPNDIEITVLERTIGGTVLSQFDRHADDWKKEREYQLTESEIKQDFEWAWQFAKEVDKGDGQTATSHTYFYVFNQNNSGGYFVTDENVASEIIIEATEEVKAVERLGEILSQKPEYTDFCSCCGMRWYPEYPDVYTRYWVSDEQYEDFEEDRDGHEAMFYPLEGEHRFIPWSRYGMYNYLPKKEVE